MTILVFPVILCPVSFSYASIVFASAVLSGLFLGFFKSCRAFPRAIASLSCSFLLQGLFLPARFIPSLLFCAAGMISSAQFHPQLALFFRRDDFDRSDSSPACSFSPQRLSLPLVFIPSLLFFSTGIISTARIHPQLALFFRRDDFDRSDSSPACSVTIYLPPQFIQHFFYCFFNPFICIFSMSMPKKARQQYFVWTIFVDCISTSLRPLTPANSACYWS